jgi:hypothetical protein
MPAKYCENFRSWRPKIINWKDANLIKSSTWETSDSTQLSKRTDWKHVSFFRKTIVKLQKIMGKTKSKMWGLITIRNWIN